VISVLVSAPVWREALDDAPALCRRAGRAVLGALGAPGAPVELSITLSDDASLRSLNARYRERDAPTNVLSFAFHDLTPDTPLPVAPPPGERLALGDVIIAFETVRREADREAKPLADHLRHLVVHGVLHILGEDHEEDGQARRMEAKERRILAALGVPDPYAPSPDDAEVAPI